MVSIKVLLALSTKPRVYNMLHYAALVVIEPLTAITVEQKWVI